MTLYKNIGDERYNSETGTGDDDVSYIPEESEATSPEERSDEARIREGDIEVDNGKDEIYVDPHSSYSSQKEEEEEEETGEEPEEEEEPRELNKEEETDEEESEEEEVKTKPGEPSPEVVALAKKYSQKRINKISREKFELRDENEELRRQLKKLKEKAHESDTAQKRAEHSLAKPQYEDFEDDADFYEALGRWSAKDEIYNHEASKPAEEVEPTAEEQEQLDFENIRDKILTDGGEKYEDFAELVLKTDGSIAITREMVLAAGDSDNAADIFYYLGQNPEESHRLAQLRGNQIAREIGLIESKFLVDEVTEHKPGQDNEFAEKSKKKKKVLNKPASPPPPIKPIGGGGRQPVDLDKADIASYFEARGYDRTGMKKRFNT